MKRGLGMVLAGLGGFLLVFAPVLKFWVVPELAVAPLSPGESTGGLTTSINRGVFDKYFDFGTLKVRENVPVTATRTTRGDVAASQTDKAKKDNLAIYDSFSNVTDDSGTTLSASTIRIAFNRTTSELNNCCGVNNGGKVIDWKGIAPLKMPFFVEKKSYDYFDTSIDKAMKIDFKAEEDLFGLKVYRFEGVVEPTEIRTLDVPGSLVGLTEPTVKGHIMYSVHRTLWVEPWTGSIVKGSEHQLVTGRTDPAGKDLITLVEGTVGGADPEVKKSVEDTKSSASLLANLSGPVPLACFIIGLLLLIGAFFLARKESAGSASYAAAPEA